MSRPQRNRRLSRRMWSPDHDLHSGRPVKRLFTPEIKRMLKDWLIRRRENPYPSRDEKKNLALETGLTYTQICNWFANWRRKLKQSEHEKKMNSWGTLIRNYNTHARGNVEQFSISSEDSIWEEDLEDNIIDEDDLKTINNNNKRFVCINKSQSMKPKEGYEYYHNYYKDVDNSEKRDYYPGDRNHNIDVVTPQCLQKSSKIKELTKTKNATSTNPASTDTNLGTPKYKQKMMEKYLRDTYNQVQISHKDSNNDEEKLAFGSNGTTELSKWLESAANFTPNKNNYFIEWNERNKNLRLQGQKSLKSLTNADPTNDSTSNIYTSMHHKDELDAAEALANLAFNCRQRIMDPNENNIHKPMNVLSS